MNEHKTTSFGLQFLSFVLLVSLVLVGVHLASRADDDFPLGSDSDGATDAAPGQPPSTDDSKEPDTSDSSASEDTGGGTVNEKQVLMLSDYKRQLGFNDGQYWVALNMQGKLKPLTHYTLTWSFDSVAMKQYNVSFIYREDESQVRRPAIMYFDSPKGTRASPDLTFLRANDTIMCSGTQNFATGSNPDTAFFYMLAFDASNDDEAVRLTREFFSQCVLNFTLTER